MAVGARFSIAALTAVLSSAVLVGLPSPAEGDDLLPFIYSESPNGTRVATALPTVALGIASPSRADTNLDGVDDMKVGYSIVDPINLNRFTVTFTRLKDGSGNLLPTGRRVELVVPLPLGKRVDERRRVNVGLLGGPFAPSFPEAVTANVGTGAYASTMSAKEAGLTQLKKSDVAVEVLATHPKQNSVYMVTAGAFNGPARAAPKDRVDPLVAGFTFSGKQLPKRVFLAARNEEFTDAATKVVAKTTTGVISNDTGTSGSLTFRDKIKHVDALVRFVGPKAMQFKMVSQGDNIGATYFADKRATAVHPTVVIDEHVDETTKEKKPRVAMDIAFSDVPTVVSFSKITKDSKDSIFAAGGGYRNTPFEEIGKVEGTVTIGPPKTFASQASKEMPYFALAKHESNGNALVEARVLGLRSISVIEDPLEATVNFGKAAFPQPLRVVATTFKDSGATTAVRANVKNLPSELKIGPLYKDLYTPPTGPCAAGCPVDFYLRIAASEKNALGGKNTRPAADVRILTEGEDGLFKLRDIPQVTKLCMHSGLTCSRATAKTNDWGSSYLDGAGLINGFKQPKVNALKVFKKLAKVSFLLELSEDAAKRPLKIDDFALCNSRDTGWYLKIPDPDDAGTWHCRNKNLPSYYKARPQLSGIAVKTAGLQLASASGDYPCYGGSYPGLIGLMLHSPHGFIGAVKVHEDAKKAGHYGGCYHPSSDAKTILVYTAYGDEYTKAWGYGTFLDLHKKVPTQPLAPNESVGKIDCNKLVIRLEGFIESVINGAHFLDGC